MKLGMNLYLWTDDATGEGTLPVLERLAAMGFDGVEIPIFTAAPEKYAALGRRLDALGLARTAITAVAPEHDPTSADPAVRRAGLAWMRGILESSAALAAPLLGGPLYAPLGVFSGRPATGDEWSRGVESVRAMAEAAAPLGLSLALEPLNRFEIYLLNGAADGARFVREVGHPRCGLLYDTFHAHIEEKNVAAALGACRDVLRHVHVAENDRSTPGRGQVRWDETFAALAEIGYDGWLTIEAFGTALPRLAAATKMWRRLYGTEDELAREGLAFLRGRTGRTARPTEPGAS
jgi:D-psicose/D-tagatose/L-ribulose 3-epimerase